MSDTVNTVEHKGSGGNTIYPTPRSRGWIIVLNNYSEEEYEAILSQTQNTAEKYILAKELGTKKQTPHIQGYVYFRNAKSVDQFKSWVNNKRVHIEPAKAGPQANLKYCSKDNNYVTNIKEKRYKSYEEKKKELLRDLFKDVDKRQEEETKKMIELLQKHNTDKHTDNFGEPRDTNECWLCQYEY